MKRRKQIGKLMYTPRWNQGDVKLGEDYESLTRDEKLEVLANWISELLSIRNAMIPNPKSWHHFMDKKSWHGLTAEERNHARNTVTYSQLAMTAGEWAEAVQIETERRLKEKNT